MNCTSFHGMTRTRAMPALVVVLAGMAACARIARCAGTLPASGPVSATQPGVEMRIMMVADAQGHVLRAGQTGWVRVRLYNPTSRPVNLITGLPLGYAAGEKPCSYPHHAYFGFSVAAFEYSFLNEKRVAVASGVISPPDDELRMPPDGWRWLYRQIKAPDLPGTYDLVVTLDFRPIIEALCTLSNAAVPPPEQGWVLRARADGVVIGDPAKGAPTTKSGARGP